MYIDNQIIILVIFFKAKMEPDLSEVDMIGLGLKLTIIVLIN